MALDFGANKEFDLARNRAKQQEAANLKGQKDALARRAAQLGGGPSGAFIKQEQIAGDESAKRLGQANEGIDAMQAQEQRRLNEIEQGQKFVTSERVGSQDFSAGQAKLGREFVTSERLGSQGFATGEREASQKYGDEQGAIARAFAQNERLGSEWFQSSQMGRQLDQATAHFEWEKYIDQENLALAKRMEAQNAKGGFMDNLFGGGGGGGWGGTNWADMVPGVPKWARVAANPMSAGISAGAKKLKLPFS